MLRIEGLRAGYGTQGVLEDVTFHLPPGRFVALLGPNAAGKTTLLRVITGVLRPWRGTVTWQGRDLTALSPRARARLVAMVPQARRLPPGFTVYQTVLLGRTPYLNWLGFPSARDRQAVERALHLTGLTSLAHRAIHTLSGGEQQRVLVARALAQDTPIVLFDEPTTHLDLRYQMDILGLARRLAHEEHRAVLAVLHDLNQAALYADTVILLHRGRIVASGPPQEVLTPSRIQDVYGVETEILRCNGSLLVVPRLHPNFHPSPPPKGRD